jgi:L-fuconolactonase
MIDAHFHSWLLARGDYGWLTPAMGVIYRDVAVADWQKLAQPLGITGGILVQAAPTAAETAYLQALADVNPAVLGVVGWVDFMAIDAAARIEKLATHPKLKGLRPMLHDLPDPDWILQLAVQPALEAMARLGLVFDALIRPVHLPNLLKLAKLHPNLAIVVDHGAKPEIAHGLEAAWQPWADGMAALAGQANVYCKLSGLLTEAGSYAEPSICKPWIEFILQIFGSERILWGGDWPVLELAGDYQTWFEVCQSLTSHLTTAQKDNIFHHNANSIYKLY